MIQKIASASQSSTAYTLRSAPFGASSSNVCAISSAEICLCTSAVDMRYSPNSVAWLARVIPGRLGEPNPGSRNPQVRNCAPKLDADASPRDDDVVVTSPP